MRGAIVIVLGLLAVAIPSPASARDPRLIDHGAAFSGGDREHGGTARPAYTFNPGRKRWHGRLITYHNRAKRYALQVRQAARTWNSSGIGVRWKAVPAHRARVTITVSSKIATSGYALLLDNPSRGSRRSSGGIWLRPDIAKWFQPAEGSTVVAQVVAHEMGHVMGLQHETRKCAVMNAQVGVRCDRPPEAWRHRCRLVERDDLVGAAVLFRGRARRLAAPFCFSEPAPPPVQELTATASPAGVKLTWRNSALSSAGSLDIARGEGGICPKRPEGMWAGGDGLIAMIRPDGPGSQQAREDHVAPVGELCYAVFPSGKLGRPGDAATARVSVQAAAPHPTSSE